ncbi:MAG: hypothetical protein ACHQRM_14160 [Bacteroidia bacterium]
MISRLLFALLLILGTMPGGAQYLQTSHPDVALDTLLTTSITDNMEFLAESSGNEEDDYTELLTSLIYFADHPLYLNTASRGELLSLGILSDFQVNNLFIHIQKNGKLISKYELQSIAGFDLQTIHKLMPYIRIGDPNEAGKVSWKQAFKQPDQVVSIQYSRVLEQEKGYIQTTGTRPVSSPGSHFTGSPGKLLLRYQLHFGNYIQAGFLALKNEGEAFFTGPEKQGFDSYSMHLQVSNFRKLKKLVAGDYSLCIGQGLLAWNGLAFSRTSEPMQIKKYSEIIQPHTSSSRNGFLSGLAAELQEGSWNLVIFISSKKRDAVVTDTSQNGHALTFRTIQTSGLHATLTELASKNTIQQEQSGARAGFEKHCFGFGCSYMYTHFNASLNPKPVPYEFFAFRGNELQQTAVDYHLLIRNLNCFGEAALNPGQAGTDQKGGLAALQGMILSLDEKLSISLLYRYYSPAYHSFTSNAFSEGGKTSNEQGYYFGLLYNPGHRLDVSAYIDFFSYPWLHYRMDAPVSGKSILIQATWHSGKNTTYQLLVRSKDKPLDPPASLNTAEINYPQPLTQTNVRFCIKTRLYAWIQWQTRMEWTGATDSLGTNETGYFLLQEIILHPSQRYACTLSYALFDTPSGNTRFYAYQHSLPGAYSIPSFSGRGSRFSILGRYTIRHGPEVWVALSRLFYDDRLQISPGTPYQIQGPHKTQISFELKWKF